MQITVVTINYNNLAGLEKTMESVFLQSYPDIQYIIIDGGSTDGSKDIIAANSKRLDYWVSEPDDGIFAAMNKGLKQAKGDYILFLNSGDYLVDGKIIASCAKYFSSGSDIYYGGIYEIKDDRIIEQSYNGFNIDFDFFLKNTFAHQGTFIKRELAQKYPYDMSLKIAADWKFFIDAVCKYNAVAEHLPLFITNYDAHGLSAQPENQELGSREKNNILENEYKMFYKEHLELMDLRYYTKSRPIKFLLNLRMKRKY